MSTVPFTEEDVMAYLDVAINHWRQVRDDPDPLKKDRLTEQVKAIHYIDAFQSVRTSLFGETLPE